MKRLIDYYLQKWKNDPFRKPVLLRGARQVGKTYAVRNLATSYSDFLEINFEEQPSLAKIFKKDLTPSRIIEDLFKETGHQIIIGKTLLFFDEIRLVPEALLSLRYFYEKMPELHVIAAGSLVDFAIQKVGIPVGRVDSLFMYPLSFLEFLSAIKKEAVIEEIINHSLNEKIDENLHENFLKLVAEYLAVGGMPEAVRRWILTKDLKECFKVNRSIEDTYRQDFNKYGIKDSQIKHLEILFDNIPKQMGKKFNYDQVEGNFKISELSPGVDLLETATVIYKIRRTNCAGLPLGAGVYKNDFKVSLLDVALGQVVLKLRLGPWLTNPLKQLGNKGNFVEAFIGQEILAYSDPSEKFRLFYWESNVKGAEAEVDYLIQQDENIIPIVLRQAQDERRRTFARSAEHEHNPEQAIASRTGKSGTGTTLQSLHSFLNSHQNLSPFGICFSTKNYSRMDKIHSYPLYAVAKAMVKDTRILSVLK